MVDSIVTGLGRKSLMILDNLGLSAAEIKERMKETGDMTKAVGAIIRDRMAAAGDYVETAADRAAQANVSLQNKMEELGRKFAPVEEASNHLWTSMKIGILDIIGGPIARLLNELTEAGRQMNALRDINGDGSNGAETRSGKALRILREYSGGGRGIEGKRELYDRQVASFQNQEEKEWRKANRLRDELAGLRKQQRENGAAGNLSPLIQETSRQLEEAVNRAKAFQIARNEYIKGGKDIMKPVKVNIQTDNAIKSVDELKVKLTELQAQRKKVAAGSDEAKRLDTEIRQVKADIKLQDPNALKTTATTTPKEKAAEMVSTAERTYAETLEKAAIRMEVGLDSELENKKKALSAQERLFDAYNDAYATYKDPKYKEAANEAANKIKLLAVEVKQMEDAVKASKIKWEQGASGFNQKTMSAWMQGRQSDLSKVEYGTKEYKDISANIADMNSIKTVLDTAIKNAIDTTQIDMTPLWSKMFGETLPEGATASLSDALTKMYEQAFDNVNIDDASLQDVIDKINEKLKEMKLDGIKIDFTTGEIARNNRRKKNDKNDDTKYKEVNLTKEFGAMNGGISQIVGGLEQLGIEIPSGLQSVIGGMQAITGILTGISATILAIEALVGADTFLPFAGGGVIPHFAGGGTVDAEHAPDFLSFSKGTPIKFADGGVIPKFATGGVIPKFAGGGTVDTGHAPDFLSFSKGAAKKFATGGVIPKFEGGGTVDAGHAPDFLSFSKGVTKRFASGGTIPHANDGYFVGGTHFSSDVTPIMANAGELVLNKAQQGVLANQLQGGNIGNLGLSVKVTAEELRFILGNNSRRRGKGEYVTSTKLR
jgi:hypothetical protein